MSTNFYLHGSCVHGCEHCAIAELHIGKRSGGWTFGFRGYPEHGITTRKDWEDRISRMGTIHDEYGREYTPEQFWREVDETREPWGTAKSAPLARYGRYADNRTRRDPDGWDFYDGEFS